MNLLKETPRQVPNNSATLTDENSVWMFFASTIAWTYLFWGLRALIANDIISLGISPDTLKFIGGFGPTIMAMLLTYRRLSKAGLTSLLKRGLDYGFSLKWWIPLLVLTTTVSYTAYRIVKVVTPIPNITQFGEVFSSFSGFMGGLFVLLLISVAEEFGWRGYALDRLQTKYDSSRFTAVKSSIILGIVWAFWHLPLFYTPGEGKSFEIQYFPHFLVMTVLLAVSLTWLHNNTNGSVLSAIIFHASVNFSGIVIPVTRSYAVPSSLGYLALDGIILVVTAVIVLVFGAKRLVRDFPQPRENVEGANPHSPITLYP